jgi:4-carboxymuconolactone decarboxylase
MDDKRWTVGEVSYVDRMPPLSMDSLNEQQRKVAEELIKGPRGGVKGPFIPLLRSPELVERLGKLGEYLRFSTSLQPRVSEFVMVVVSREWTNQFEWAVHVPLALKNGVTPDVVDAIAEGRYPRGMATDEEVAYEICQELSHTKSVCDTTYRRAVDVFGERGVIDITTVYGYFVTVCAIMNLAHTPPPADTKVAPLSPYPR